MAAGLAALMAAPALAATLISRAAELPASLPDVNRSSLGPAPSAPRSLSPHAALKTRVGAAGLATTRSEASPSRTAVSPRERAEARAILSRLTQGHPELGSFGDFAPATVEFGETPDGYQAVAYYRLGRIVVSPSHTASLATILRHEAGHVIDWRDNGRIDWGERPVRP